MTAIASALMAMRSGAASSFGMATALMLAGLAALFNNAPAYANGTFDEIWECGHVNPTTLKANYSTRVGEIRLGNTPPQKTLVLGSKHGIPFFPKA